MNLVLLIGLMAMAQNTTTEPDPYAWLEDISGARSLEYVRQQNSATQAELEARPEYATLRRQVLEILNSRDRIPLVQKLGSHYYNFWQDAANPRGLWRRTSPAEYARDNPNWETVLDLDALAQTENENWVWAGSHTLPPDYTRSLVSLSRGGGDAKVVREFDLSSKQFVADGFSTPQAKTHVTWRDRDTLLIGTDFGAGSLTASGYPRLVKRWQRGTPLAEAKLVYEGQATDVSASGWVDHTPGYFREGLHRSVAFYNSETFLSVDGRQVQLDVPRNAEPSLFKSWLTVQLRSDWTVGGTTYPAGALVVTKLDAFLHGERAFEMLFEPRARLALRGVTATKHSLVLSLSQNVLSQIRTATPGKDGWQQHELKLPGLGAASVSAIDSYESDDLWLSYQDFLTPAALYKVTLGDTLGAPLKSMPGFFDSTGMEVQQLEATSADGVRVPYFVVGQSAAIKSGTAPTILYGYGGFEISQAPRYSPAVGKIWLERGGVYVLANIRGGGEFGPAWHQAALKGQRQRAFDDFEAIAADLVQRGLTTVKHLGIMGGSNGGLLVSTVAVQRPELFGAVVCQVPLTDMRRFHKLLAGASWMAEYGDPDKPEDWAYLAKYSPYQNAQADAKYPRILFTTSTRDDRVHPAHARKLYAKLKDQGHDVLYYENTEGGHAGAANNEQRAHMNALEFTFLWQTLH